MRVAVRILGLLGVAAAMGLLATRASARTVVESLDEAGVVAIFDLANTADIETGRLAASRARLSEVREFGTMLAGVHTDVRQKGRDLAKRLGITPTLPAGDQGAQQHAAALARLKALSGEEFDRAFLEHEEAFHIAVIAAVKSTLLPAIRNQELKEFVTALAPAFDSHREMAAHLLRKHGLR